MSNLLENCEDKNVLSKICIFKIIRMSNRRNRVSNLGVLLLAHQLFTTSNVPPITLSVILAQVAIFLGFVPSLDETKIGLGAVWLMIFKTKKPGAGVVDETSALAELQLKL
uniref:Uncharacterized protein n=1 Tax=Romanomermis culicivorax TaxID=13658 RepID=A0A915ILK1_ROMCU